MSRTRSADVLIMKDGKPIAGQTGASFEASNEFEEFVDRVTASVGQCMTSRELTGQDFSIDMSAVANLSDKSDESVFRMLWDAWKNAKDLDIKLSVKKTTYSASNNTDVDDLINATVPYGEETALYSDLAKNLTNAATVLGKANKNL